MRDWLWDQIIGKFIVEFAVCLILQMEGFFCLGIDLNHANILYVKNVGETLEDNFNLEVKICSKA